MRNLYDLDFLISLVIWRGLLKGIKEGLVRFQIAKIVAWLFVNSEISSVQESVFLYRYGPYVLKFEDALADLVRRNVLEVVTENKGQTRFALTDEGQRWIMSRLRDQEYKNIDSLIREIDMVLFTPISDLMIGIAEKSPLLKPTRRFIGGKELIRIFDWRNFGDGKVHGYHYTLLRSFYGLEDYFDSERIEAEKKIEEGDIEYQVRIVDYSAIPEVMYSEDLLKNVKERHTVRYIFKKQDPRSVNVDKFEGKNYVGHLWYIYSAIGIIHVLAGLAPTADEVARMCLTDYEHAMKREISYSEKRKMREGAIRSDLQKLTKYDILNKTELNRTYFYSIRAKAIIDSFAPHTYSLLSAEEIKSLYEREIRPSPANISTMRRIRAREIAVAMEG